MLGNEPYVLGNGLQVLGNGNGPHMLGTVLCRIRILSHSVLCRIRGYVVWHYVVRDYVAFGDMSFSIMLHSA